MRIDDANRPSQAPGVERADSAETLEGDSEARLEALRLQVQSGRYQVSSAELASKIIDEHTEA